MSVGVHYPYTSQGLVFSQTTTPLGLALPLYTTTTVCTTAICGLPILNLTQGANAVNVELISLDINYGSLTADFGSIGLMIGQVASIGTATGCSAFASTTPMNGLPFGPGSKVLSNNGVGTCTVTAGTAGGPVAGVAGAGWYRSLFTMNLESSTGTAHGTSSSKYTFDGTMIVPPNTIAYFAATKATVALYSATVVWKEIPIVR